MTVITIPSTKLEIHDDHQAVRTGPIGDLYLELRAPAHAPNASTIIVDPHYSQTCRCRVCTLPKGV